MRWHIIRTLVYKEACRHLADRGGIFLALLLVSVTVLMSFFGKDSSPTAPFFGGVQLCYVDYWEKDSPWVEHLRGHLPRELKIHFRPAETLPTDSEGRIVYPKSTAAVQIRTNGQGADGRARYLVWFWHPGRDRSIMAPFVQWFWKESLRYFQDYPVEIDTAEEQLVYPDDAASIQIRLAGQSDDGQPHYKLLFWRPKSESPAPAPYATIQEQWLRLGDEDEVCFGGVSVERSTVTTILVMFALFLFCVYLLPSFTCEERERGVLLAQALSPASPWEILGAKFLFYPAMAMGLSALLAGIWSPAVLARPFFWVVLATATTGYLGVGMTIASLAGTQRTASMGALCYLLTVAMLLFVTERFGIPSIRFVALEYYCPRILEAVMRGPIAPWQLLTFGGGLLVACSWAILATVLFRYRGWQ